MDFKGFTILTPAEYFSNLPDDVAGSARSIPSSVVLLFEGGKFLGAFLSTEEAQAFAARLLEYRNQNSKEQSPYVKYRNSLSQENQDLVRQANKVVKEVEWEMDDLDTSFGSSLS